MVLRAMTHTMCSSAILLFSCSVPGPVLQKNDLAKAFVLPGVGVGVGLSTWSFQAANGGWTDLRTGELILSRRSPLRPDANFELRIVARNRNGSLRFKTYEGVVTRDGDTLDLHAERCRIYGKKDFIDRIVPLEGWTCDHLVFRFRITANSLERITDISDEKRTDESDWLYIRRLTPLASWPPQPGRPVWAGQRLASSDASPSDLPLEAPDARYGDERQPGGTLTDNDGAVYFGFDAGRHLRPGDTLLLFRKDGGQSTARILHVIDDFVLVQQAAAGAPVAGIMTTRAPQGLFD